MIDVRRTAKKVNPIDRGAVTKRRLGVAIVVLGLAGSGAALLLWREMPGADEARAAPRPAAVSWVADSSNQSQVEQGKQAYSRACAGCHGANLEGQPGWKTKLPDGRYPAPPHDQSGHTWHHPDHVLFGITKFGGQAAGPAGFSSGMPAFKDTLSDAEIAAILAYIKSRWPEEIRFRQARIGKAN